MSDEPKPHVFTGEQEARIHALNLATALHKDTFRIREGVNVNAGDEVMVDAARFAAFVLTGETTILGARGSQESTGAAK